MKTLVAILVVALCLSLSSPPASAQVRAEYDRGAGELARLLRRLQTTASVLHTGAHPDDEDSALIAYQARAEHARTAYLSLTRGSGGQNIIGPELADLLGVIRTEELLQARRFDGAGQYFTRAVDFGFSKQREEGQRIWDEPVLLGDMVRTIRQFRPDVVVSRWNGTPTDGHGHHQFAGYLTPLAVEAAADPNRYPEQLADGLSPWKVKKVYVGERRSIDSLSRELLAIDTGQLDPVAGRSYFQIGMRGRSQQKTQQMGSLELHGSQESLLRRTAPTIDALGAEESVFDGIDTSIAAIAAFEPSPSDDFVARLDELEVLASAALDAYDPFAPAALIEPLAAGLRAAKVALDLAEASDSRRLLEEKIGEFGEALVLAAGITVDALADTETAVPGDTFNVAVRLFNASHGSLAAAGLIVPGDWSVERLDQGALSSEARWRRREQPDADLYFTVGVPADAAPSQPYWLRYARQGAMYDWSAAVDAATEPFAAPLITAVVDLTVGGETIRVEREVRHRLVDRVRGELRRRFDVVPAITLEPANDLEIITTSTAQRRYPISITVQNHSTAPVEGNVALDMPDGWSLEPGTRRFSLPPAPASTAVSFELVLPDDAPAGDYRLTAKATAAGIDYELSLTEIAYPHIDTHRVYDRATSVFTLIDVDVAPVRIGYVMGSGDAVAESLRKLGLDVSLIDDDTLTGGDLSQYDTIVVGIRASQTREAYVAANGRLLEFVRAGGTMIVQYQQPDFAAKNLAPFPVQMERNVRVVDETAPVNRLAPEHPAWNYPNRIADEDFEGWIQERNNYNWTAFDRDRYVPLTESHDPGEPESDGAMLYAKLGDGHYVYTAYSFFRQLPNGTPGAYRIFANLLSLSAAPE